MLGGYRVWESLERPVPVSENKPEPDPEFRRFKEQDPGSGSRLDLCMEPEQRFLGKKNLKKKKTRTGANQRF